MGFVPFLHVSMKNKTLIAIAVVDFLCEWVFGRKKELLLASR